MNHQNFERTLHFRVILWSTLVGVSAHPPSPEHAGVLQYTSCGGGVWASNDVVFSRVVAACPPKSRPDIWRHEVVALRLSERDPINQLCGCGKWLSGDMYVSPAMKAVGDGEHEKSQIRRQHVARDTSQPRRVESIINAFGLGADSERHSLSIDLERSASAWISNQARGPAEFKHIIKRRKRN